MIILVATINTCTIHIGTGISEHFLSIYRAYSGMGRPFCCKINQIFLITTPYDQMSEKIKSHIRTK